MSTNDCALFGQTTEVTGSVCSKNSAVVKTSAVVHDAVARSTFMMPFL